LGEIHNPIRHKLQDFEILAQIDHIPAVEILFARISVVNITVVDILVADILVGHKLWRIFLWGIALLR
jgi:hypothetical protein